MYFWPVPLLPVIGVSWNCYFNRGGDCILKCSAFTHAGSYHKHNAIPCEDQVALSKANGVIAAVLADGAGSSPEGATAAALVSKTISTQLCKEFETWYYSDSNTAKRRISRIINQCLLQHSQATGLCAKSLATTVVAAAMDQNKRCVCFHLGDGMILQQSINSIVSKVSAPFTGLTNSTTCLTMNCEIGHFIRFFRWQDPDLKRLLLFTDGASNLISKTNGFDIFKTVAQKASTGIKTLEQFISEQTPTDDYSCAVLLCSE